MNIFPNKPNLPYAYDDFMEEYLCPFVVIPGVDLDGIDLYRTYCLGLKACWSLAEAQDWVAQWRFLALDAACVLRSLTPEQWITVRAQIQESCQIQEFDLDWSPVVLPYILLQARLVRERFGLPDYPAAVQFVGVFFYGRGYDGIVWC